MISQFLSVPGFPKIVFQLPAYNTHSLRWTSLMLAAVLAAACSIPSRYCLLAASSSHQGGLPPIPWMCLLLPVHLTPTTVNPSILNYSRYLLVWKLMWYWNFILVYIFLCVGKLGISSKICSESLPVSLEGTNEHLTIPWQASRQLFSL